MQHKWAFWGFAVLGLSTLVFILFFVGTFASIFVSLKSPEAYQMAVHALNSNPQAVQILGQPISTGFPTGSLNVVGPEGKASLAFSAKGPKGDGTVYVEAAKSMGQWKINEAVLEDSKSKQRIRISE